MLAAAATLTAGAAVLAVLHPLLLLACLPQAAAYIRSARVMYLAKVATAPSARAGRGRAASAVPAPTPARAAAATAVLLWGTLRRVSVMRRVLPVGRL